MDNLKIRHPFDQPIYIIQFNYDDEYNVVHVVLKFKSDSEAIDAHTKLTSLGNIFGLTVIENKNGQRVKLEFSNQTNILYTPFITYNKIELDALDLTSEFLAQLFFVFDNNGAPPISKGEPLDFLHKA